MGLAGLVGVRVSADTTTSTFDTLIENLAVERVRHDMVREERDRLCIENRLMRASVESTRAEHRDRAARLTVERDTLRRRIAELEAERDGLLAAAAAARGERPACDVCADTHQMTRGDAEVMCTFCPRPCQSCRAGGNGPYCEHTPCSCGCHAAARGEECS